MRNLSSILVGVDFSPCSLTALKQAMRLGAASGAAVRAVHVVDTLVVVPTADELSALQTQIVASLMEDTRAMWKDFAPRAGAGGVAFEVEINSPAAAITRLASQHKADLVVLGTHGATPPGKGAGTVASSVVRRCASKVLLVQDAQVGAFKSVLAAIDFSPASKQAYEQALTMASLDNAALHVVYVYSPPWEHMRARAGSPEGTPEFRGAYVTALEERIRAFCGVAQAGGTLLDSGGASGVSVVRT